MEAYIDSNIDIDSEYIEGQQSIIVSFAGCNFNCPFCFVPQYLEFSNEYLNDLKVIKSEIERISQNANNIVFTGGEPTLQRLALGNLCRFSRNFNLSTWIHTNASKPNVLRYLLMNQLCDNFIIDIKSPLEEDIFQRTTKSANFFMQSSEIISNIKKSLELLYTYLPSISVEFRTTIFPGVMQDEHHLEEIAKTISRLHPIWIIQNFKYDEEEGILNKALLKSIKERIPSYKYLEGIKENLQRRFPQIMIEIR